MKFHSHIDFSSVYLMFLSFVDDQNKFVGFLKFNDEDIPFWVIFFLKSNVIDSGKLGARDTKIYNTVRM